MNEIPGFQFNASIKKRVNSFQDFESSGRFAFHDEGLALIILAKISNHALSPQSPFLYP